MTSSTVKRTMRAFFAVLALQFGGAAAMFSVQFFLSLVYATLDALAFRLFLVFGDLQPAVRMSSTGLAMGAGGGSAPDTFWSRLAAASWGVNNPATGLFDGGSLVVSGLVRIATGLQSYGVGNGAVAGGARGTGAVDLQFARIAASEVASGNFSALIASSQATASGTYAVSLTTGSGVNLTGLGSASMGGTGGTASGRNSVVMAHQSGNSSGINSVKMSTSLGGAVGRNSISLCGNVNTSTGNNSVSHGSQSNTSGYASFTVGSRGRTRQTGEFSHSCGFTNAGGGLTPLNAPYSKWCTWVGTTVGAVTSTLYLDGVAEECMVDPDVVQVYRLFIQARNVGAVEGALWRVFIAVERQIASQVIGGGVAVITPLFADAGVVGWTPAVTLGPGQLVRITGTGEAGKTIRWTAHSILKQQQTN